jgi:hypothetical protein
MNDGGAPTTDYVPPGPTDSFMTVNGDNYLQIDHNENLLLGDNNGDFTVSLALI